MKSAILTARLALFTLGLGLATAIIGGCSTDENPVTPDKMEELRKQEANERANFNPSAGTQKGQ